MRSIVGREEDGGVLPSRLLCCDPRPIPRFNRQEPVTRVVCDPDFYEPVDEEDCSTFPYFCQTHDRYYRHDDCGEGAHLVAVHCERHEPENMWPQPLMMVPGGVLPSTQRRATGPGTLGRRLLNPQDGQPSGIGDRCSVMENLDCGVSGESRRRP
ncbi:hypothetical protein ACIRPU_26165 [Streptomyces sp. NPDC102259]|uniref:hypothetical protein n=1 Tax=Streptomyces sp. NPDC102259 TaxID=3366148 RepID=UPI0037F864FD